MTNTVLKVVDSYDYQQQAIQLMNPALDAKGRLTNCALGLCDEAFEVSQIFFDDTGHPTLRLDDSRKARLIDECGDMFWYLSGLAHTLEYRLDDITDVNEYNSLALKNFDLAGEWYLLSEECATIAGIVKKHVFQEHPLDSEKVSILVMCIRDIAFRVVDIVEYAGSNFKDCATKNLIKLRKRYPSGKFCAKASIDRPV